MEVNVKSNKNKYTVMCQGGFAPYVFETTKTKESADSIAQKINEDHNPYFHAWVTPVKENESI